jgi:hypothetical protein
MLAARHCHGLLGRLNIKRFVTMTRVQQNMDLSMTRRRAWGWGNLLRKPPRRLASRESPQSGEELPPRRQARLAPMVEPYERQ